MRVRHRLHATQRDADANRPFAGHQFFNCRLQNQPPDTFATYVLGFAPDATNLTPAGMPGCYRNVAPAGLVSLAVFADGAGTAQVRYALPDTPVFIGDVFAQWLYRDPTAAPTPYRTTQGLRHQVR